MLKIESVKNINFWHTYLSKSLKIMVLGAVNIYRNGKILELQWPLWGMFQLDKIL